MVALRVRAGSAGAGEGEGEGYGAKRVVRKGITMLDLSHVNSLLTPLPPLQTPGSKQSARGSAPRRLSPQTPQTAQAAHERHRETERGNQTSPSSMRGPSPRARRVGYTVDLASQKLYMASLNKNRFRASLSFQEFEAGLQEALQEHAQMAEAKFEAMKAEQDEKDRQLELALRRLERAEETISVLTDRLADGEAKQAELTSSTQGQVARYAQQVGEMAGMVTRLRERVRAGAVAGEIETQRVRVAQVMQAASKLDAMIAQVQALAAQQRVSRDAVDVLATKDDALSHGSLTLERRGVESPSEEAQMHQGEASTQQRLARAGDRISQLSALVTTLEGAVRQEHSTCSADPPSKATRRGIGSLAPFEPRRFDSFVIRLHLSDNGGRVLHVQVLLMTRSVLSRQI